MSDKPTSSMKKRLNGFVWVIIFIVICYLVYTMVKISIINASQWQELASSQQLKSTTITAPRGAIYDANMDILAQSATVYTIYVDPVLIRQNIEDSEEAAEESIKQHAEDPTVEVLQPLTLDGITARLSQMLEIEQQEILSKCMKENRYQEIKKNVEKDKADEIREYAEENGISGIGATESSKRFYPENTLAASVIGHLHYDGYGIYGLEAYYDDYLSGVDGKTLIATDNRGNEIPYEYKQSYEHKDTYTVGA